MSHTDRHDQLAFISCVSCKERITRLSEISQRRLEGSAEEKVLELLVWTVYFCRSDLYLVIFRNYYNLNSSETLKEQNLYNDDGFYTDK